MFHKIVQLKVCHWAFGVLTFAASVTRAADVLMPMADHVPADALFYFGWEGADSQLQSYQASDLHTSLEHSNLRKVFEDLLPSLLAKSGKLGDRKRVVDRVQKILPLLWHHPFAIYVSKVTINPDSSPNADVALICDAGSDANVLGQDLEELIKTNAYFHVLVQQNLVILGVDNAARLLNGPSLADLPAFQATMTPLHPVPAFAAYVDVHTLLQKANEAAALAADAADIWPKVRDALGITHVNSFAIAGGFDAGNWTIASALNAPGPRTGLLQVFEPKSFDPVLLSRIPASAESVLTFNFDAAKLFDTIGAAMAVRKESDTVFHQAGGLATIGLGRNFRKQFLGSLGPQWVLFRDPASSDIVLLNHPTDADNASDALVSATFGLVNIANAQIPGASTQPVASAEQKTIKGIDLTSAITKYSSPTFAVKDGVIYFGYDADAVVAAAITPATPPGPDVKHKAVLTFKIDSPRD